MTKDKDRHPTNPEYAAWRQAVFERDQGLCQICGGKGHEVHHIIGWTRDPDRRYDVKNGITLCISCHEKTDNYYRPGFKIKRTKKKHTKKPAANAFKYISTTNPTGTQKAIDTTKKINAYIAEAEKKENEKPFLKKRNVQSNIGCCSAALSCLVGIVGFLYQPPDNIKWITWVIWSFG